jgi:sugar phosphate isomerase/epimerase
MRLAIISDEISRDPLTAAEIAAEWGLRHLELRMYYGARAPQGMSDADIAAVAQAAATFGLDVPSISPGLFKLRRDDPALGMHRGGLRTQCLDMAEALGARVMVVFPYIRARCDEPDNGWPNELVDDLRATAELAAARGIAVAIENEPICYAADGRSLARLLAEIDHPNCGANWDPANAYAYQPQDFRVGYEALRGRIVHVHIKDHAPQPDGTRRVVPAGEGAVGWPEQVRALIADGYDGLAVIETHFTPKVAAGRACVQAIRRILDEAGESLE